MYTLNALGIYLAVLILLFLVRKPLGLFISVALFFGATVAWLAVGFEPGVPASVMVLYVATMLIALGLYVTSSEESRAAFLGPIIAVMVKKSLVVPRVLLLFLIPATVAWATYHTVLPSETAPPKVRSVHPSPPGTIKLNAREQVGDRVVDIIKEDSPYRAYQTENLELYKEKVATGKVVYYQNCYYCHGDYMAADGHYASAVKPPPASFQDPGTIAMLEETFLFWRVSKGGPGLPDAGTPWDSSMPVWEDMLTEDEMWSVILFMYDYTGYKPRTKETGHQGGGH
jgi:hypothetical protein